MPLLEIQDLEKEFKTAHGIIKALDQINLILHAGETLGLVGESGCGKSTLGKIIAGLIKPTRGKISTPQDVQMIFQDPSSSLNPRMTAEEIIKEPLLIHKRDPKEVLRLLDLVGLGQGLARRYPHELSGGQKQRIGIARALALKPRLVICDEAVSALDVSIQAQIVTLLQELQKEFQLTYLFISHDLNITRYLSDRIAVMYLGKIVEIGPADTLIQHPCHPYTQALISSIPIPDPRLEKARTKMLLNDEIILNTTGCTFHPRCPKRLSLCEQCSPSLKLIHSHQSVACHLYTI